MKNHVTHHHPRLTSVLALPLKSLIVHVEKAPLRQIHLSIHLSIHSHLELIVPRPSRHAILSARNQTLLVLIRAKSNATTVPVLHVQSPFYVHADVGLRREVWPVMKPIIIIIHPAWKRMTFCVINHALLYVHVDDINVGVSVVR